MSTAEIARLGEALAAHPERTSAHAVRLLLLTGSRKSEALCAKWDEIDLAAGTWTKPSAHTKQKKEHRVPLSAPAMALLQQMRAEAEEELRRVRKLDPKAELGLYVFPGTDGQPLHDIKRSWASICARADIKGARIHDLRHSFPSILASAGMSLPLIGALPGHTQAATTHRYAHLADDPLRVATERAAAIIGGAGRDGAEVVPLEGRRA